MRLKSLEIKGFKSFANETIINFNQNVIGIVGPNGAGKSNVVDAIRWVLGEQKSKELRLDKMSSVIFNGTKKRKESGMAQVTLSFENTRNLIPTDYTSVSISRILYRSGESEYRLNNVPCRLKDISTLFLDTGIGSNSYAIIALGMVDDILSDKENARRRMFEQAAGVSKYKARKQETLSKLEGTAADLDRVEDLLQEINENVKNLEKQAKRTQKYLDFKAQYRELSLDLAIFQLTGHKKQYKEVEAKLHAEMDKYQTLTAEMAQTEAVLEAEKKINLDKEQTLSTRQRDLNQLVGRIRGLENEQNIVRQKIDFIGQNKIKLGDQIKGAKIRTAHLEQDIQGFSNQLSEENVLERALESQLKSAEHLLRDIRIKHGNVKNELDTFLQSQQKIETSLFENDKKKAVQANQIENLHADWSRNLDTMRQRLAETGSLENTLKELQSTENQLLQSINEAEIAEKNRVASIDFIQKQLETHRGEMVAVRRQLDANQNEYKLIKSMVDSLEGFPESVKYLSKRQKEWSKNAPLLSDLLLCKEEFRVAVENFLEPYLSYFVVQNLNEATTAIELLKQTQKGRANFFILDYIDLYPVTKNNNIASLIIAREVVEVEAQYKKLCDFLLQNVYISEHDAFENPSKAVILSKSGNLISRPESSSGGSIGLFEGKKIGRKKNLEIITQIIQQLQGSEAQLLEEIGKLQLQLSVLQGKDKQAFIQKEKNDLNRVLQEKISIQTKLDNLNSFQKEVEEKNQSIKNFIEKLEQEHKILDQLVADLRADLLVSQQNRSVADNFFRQLAEDLTNASGNFNTQNVSFIQQQNRVSAVRRELSFREKQLEETKYNLEKEENSLQNANNEEKIIVAQLSQISNNLKNYLLERKEKEVFLNEAEQSYFQVRGKINETENAVKKINRQHADNQILIANLKDKFNEIKVHLSAIGERLKIEFNIHINDLFNQEPNAKLVFEELQEQVQKIKFRLDNYGEINPLAVEAYREMSERHATISAQRDDILGAKNSLLETIKEIEITATQQFMISFEQIRTNFIDVFRSLFTEDDTCDLVLENPSDPLESAINIIAKPKGKRPQSIHQLSGGEKTLTATALLFALYLLKPAPFCIFDEVDAPLDDANIEKFNRIIKKFSTDSQFIIVTHNKQTMAAVDVIYGVYMPEQGVSGVSAVDFRTLENTNILGALN